MRLRLQNLATLVTSVLSLTSVFNVLAHPGINRFSRRHVGRNIKVPAAAPGAVALHQYQVPRDLLDICVILDADTIVGLDIIDIPIEALLDLDLCLCLSLLPIEVSADIQLQTLLDVYGVDVVNAALSLIINTSPDSRHCSYPPNSNQVCEPDNPCGWNCNPPYVKQGDECVCPSQNIVCNGVCGSFPNGCGSSTPYRRSPQAIRMRSDSVATLADAELTCGPHQTVCGIYGGSSRAFECLDVDTELESCGGCTVPNPFIPDVNTTIGIDCAAIPGVDSVSCLSGKCAVTTCRNGWAVNSDGDGCVAMNEPAAIQDLKVQMSRRMLKKRSSPIENFALDRAVGKREDILDTSANDLDADVPGLFDLTVSDLDLDVTRRDEGADELAELEVPVTFLDVSGLLGADVEDLSLDVSKRQGLADIEDLKADMPGLLDIDTDSIDVTKRQDLLSTDVEDLDVDIPGLMSLDIGDLSLDMRKRQGLADVENLEAVVPELLDLEIGSIYVTKRQDLLDTDGDALEVDTLALLETDIDYNSADITKRQDLLDADSLHVTRRQDLLDGDVADLVADVPGLLDLVSDLSLTVNKRQDVVDVDDLETNIPGLMDVGTESIVVTKRQSLLDADVDELDTDIPSLLKLTTDNLDISKRQDPADVVTDGDDVDVDASGLLDLDSDNLSADVVGSLDVPQRRDLLDTEVEDLTVNAPGLLDLDFASLSLNATGRRNLVSQDLKLNVAGLL